MTEWCCSVFNNLKWISDHRKPENVCTDARRSLTAFSCFAPAALFLCFLSCIMSCFWRVEYERPFVAFLFAHILVIRISLSQMIMLKGHWLLGHSRGNGKGQINCRYVSNIESVWFSSFPITEMTLFPLIKHERCQESDLNFPAMQR